METVFNDYRDKVQFYYVYKHVQHPEINNFVSAFSLEERLKHVNHAKRLLKTEIPWICDSMENEVKRAFGGAPNGEFVLDPDGKIVVKRFWSNPQQLRKDLAELVGPSEKITKVGELPAGFELETREIASGVVPRIQKPAGLSPLVLEPVDDGGHPWFAKLRVEGTGGVLADEREGKLYLALYPDPLYRVHWNNRAGRVSISIEPNDQMAMDPKQMVSPEVQADADVDSREFLVDIARGDSTDPLMLSVNYTICDDDETFCTEVEQRYRLRFERTRNLGSRPGIFMPAMFAKVKKYDQNGDGDITAEELPRGQVTLYVGHIDFDGDGVLQAKEIDTFLKMFNNGRGFDSALNDGQKPPTESDDEDSSDQ